MNRWLQTRLFECPKCGASYTHDQAYFHDLFQCLKRNMPGPVTQRRVA